MKPKISIGVPFRDPGVYFELALKSVFAQTFTDWELILLDDGSKDNSLGLAQSLRDPRVRVYSDGQNLGLSARLNQMIQLAEAPYFARMDADDIMHPNRLERQYQVLIQQNADTVLGTAAYSLDAESRVIGFRSSRLKQRLGFEARLSFIHPTVMASTHWFRKNPYSEKLVYRKAQDAELWCRTSPTTRFINLPEPLLYYREAYPFSPHQYMATAIGLLNLMLDMSEMNNGLRFASLLTKEMSKLWVALVLARLGAAEWLVARRYRRLDSDALRSANEALAIVRQERLPLD